MDVENYFKPQHHKISQTVKMNYFMETWSRVTFYIVFFCILIVHRTSQIRILQASFISVLLSFCRFFQHCLKFSSYNLTFVSTFLYIPGWICLGSPKVLC